MNVLASGVPRVTPAVRYLFRRHEIISRDNDIERFKLEMKTSKVAALILLALIREIEHAIGIGIDLPGRVP